MSTPRLPSTFKLREAILLCFRDPIPATCEPLWHLTARQWQPLLHWMDVSGLALYFLDRVTQSRQEAHLPAEVLARLQQNLQDSTNRMAAMAAEATAIQGDFKTYSLRFAVLKGFSLWPVSVPKMELRSQLDLDYLVTESDAVLARKLLEARGYSLRAVSGRTWEFRSSEPGIASLRTIYKAPLQRAVELHLERTEFPGNALTMRTEIRMLHGMNVPVLGQTDLFLGQGLHLYKHVCSEFSRAAHLLEFYRHILVRFHDDTFWHQLQALAEQTPGAPAALGVVAYLIGHLMGDFAPVLLTSWTIERLPAAARLWVELYGRRCVLGDQPGNKLYLLLQPEMQSTGLRARRSTWRGLLPTKLPPKVFPTSPAEDRWTRLDLRRRDAVYRLSRLHFHISQGIIYMWEYRRWQRIQAKAVPAGQAQTQAVKGQRLHG